MIESVWGDGNPALALWSSESFAASIEKCGPPNRKALVAVLGKLESSGAVGVCGTSGAKLKDSLRLQRCVLRFQGDLGLLQGRLTGAGAGSTMKKTHFQSGAGSEI